MPVCIIAFIKYNSINKELIRYNTINPNLPKPKNNIKTAAIVLALSIVACLILNPIMEDVDTSAYLAQKDSTSDSAQSSGPVEKCGTGLQFKYTVKEYIEKYNGVTAEGLVESALEKVAMIEQFGYDQLVISIKSSDVMMCVKAHELIADKTPYPLHVGITEAGTIISGNIKSSIGLALILNQGIGNTIRVSLTGDPVEEIRSAKIILKTLGIRKGGAEIVSCPTCGRTQIDLIRLANEAETLVSRYPYDIKVAVMGCVVNGPGEAKEADLGIAGGLGCGVIIKKGEIIRKLPEEELLAGLKEELDNWQA